MATKQTRAKKPAAAATLFGLPLSALFAGQTSGGKPGKAKGSSGQVVFVGQGAKAEDALAAVGLSLPAWLWQRAEGKRPPLETLHAATADGPVWVLMAQEKTAAAGHDGLFKTSAYGVARDLSAQLVASLAEYGLSELHWHFQGASVDEQRGSLVGCELGAYRFKGTRGLASAQPRLVVHGADAAVMQQAGALATATNIARHLVNLPASELNPATYAEAMVELFSELPGMTVEVWTGKRLVQERMGLLLGVGQGASTGPALVHLRYRPKKAAKGVQPVAFVGKGITFDSGGLDLKTGGSMRLMKKDMGGSASLAGFAYWVATTGSPQPCDIYLALAENAVDERSMHPGDILTARNGLTIEIDNTDAEGRLVLADALDVAVTATGADAPSAVINLATLTGAMRVALGLRIGGLFASDDELAQALLHAGQTAAEPTWRMPLFGDYLAGLKSSVADLANSAPGGRGGAITAALFLQRFVGRVPWAHFDIMAWTDGNTGGCIEPGGNGQCVQMLAAFLEQRLAGR